MGQSAAMGASGRVYSGIKLHPAIVAATTSATRLKAGRERRLNCGKDAVTHRTARLSLMPNSFGATRHLIIVKLFGGYPEQFQYKHKEHWYQQYREYSGADHASHDAYPQRSLTGSTRTRGKSQRSHAR